MRCAGNLHPEWGYFVPERSFLRTARLIFVATAIGATAGAGVVFELVSRPSTEKAQTFASAPTVVPTANVAVLRTAAIRAPSQHTQTNGQTRTAAIASAGPAPSAKPPAANSAPLPAANAAALAGRGQASTQKLCRVAGLSGASLNVRAAPDGTVVDTLNNGEQVAILDHDVGSERKWVSVARLGGSDPIGWVFKRYLDCASTTAASAKSNLKQAN
jgi:hypothetical protein